MKTAIGKLANSVAALMLVTGGSAMAADSSAVAEGRQLYDDYNCAQCHGADAKTGKTANTPRLAGMALDDIYVKTRRYVEARTHDEVWRGCGETPNHVQIKRIAEYVASLPR